MKHIPNLISLGRLAGTFILVWAAWQEMTSAIGWLLLTLFLSDWLDGWLARRYAWTSRLGATLDSVADIALTLGSLFAIWIHHRYVFEEYGWIPGSVVGLWLIVHIISIVRYRRLSSFHTRFIQFGIVVWALFAISLFLIGFQSWLLYFAGLVCFVGGLEYLLMIMLVKEWQPDLPGGLLALLKERS